MSLAYSAIGLRPSTVARVVGHVIGDYELVLAVYRRLHVVADFNATSLPELHRSALWIRERELCRAARF